MPLELITGHELIHFWREITGRHNSGTAYHWINIDNRIYTDYLDNNTLGNIEEYRTVGVGNSTKDRASNIGVYGDYNRPDDITENNLRKEQGLPYRIRYEGYIDWK